MPVSHGATSLKIHVKFTDVVTNSDHVNIYIFFSRYLHYIKTELAEQFGVYMFDIYSVWEILRSLESIS